MLTQNEQIEFNDKGYLVNFDLWNKDMAEQMAKEADIELGDCHWAVINFLREYYQEYETAPSPRVIIKTIGDKVSEHTPCTQKRLESLFSTGGCKLACRLAGLPAHYCHSC